LSFHEVASGSALDKAREDYKNVYKEQQAKANIPIAWEELIAKKDEMLLDVISEKVESICGFKPTQEQIVAYLNSLKTDEDSPPTSSAPVGKPKSPLKPDVPEPEPSGRSKIKVTFLDGVEICRPKAADTMVEVLRKIGFEKVKSLNIQMYGFPIVSHKQFKQDTYNWSDAGSGVFVFTHSNTDKKISQLKEINDRLALGLKIIKI
jgi:hypothetical protein